MSAHIKQLLLIVVVALLYTNAATGPMPPPNCARKCGHVDIPFPFGTTKDCALDETFLINCNQTSQLPFLPENNKTVLNISLDLDGTLRVAWPIAGGCYAKNDTKIPDISMTHFPISTTRNKLTTIGCNTFGILIGSNSGQTDYNVTGCVVNCKNLNDDATRAVYSCPGSGCCQISLPQAYMLTEVAYRSYIYSYDNNQSSDFNQCGYVFLVEKGNINFSSTDLKLKNKEFPVSLDWAVGNQTCQQAQKDHSNACKADKSTCYNSTERSGYLCKCILGYRGNPYVVNGCQDINECVETNDCVEKETCRNDPPGSYSCLCREGYEGDGKNNGTGCTKKRRTKYIILTIALGVIVVVLVGSIYAYLAMKKRKLVKLKERFFQQNGGLLLQQQIRRHGGSIETAKLFTIEELNDATNNFDEGKILGQGGQGTVYKGVLKDKRIVAIKKFKINDPNQIQPFINEVLILSEINHRNVVKFLGCCLETEVPLLVYEFIPNGTLHEHLHDQNQSIKLTWKTRLRIAKETAGVLAYLHYAASTPIIHRDVKSTNILLDHNLTAKVSDFGASRMVPLDHSQINTLVQGTLGYLDPEYFHTSQLTEKSDVYSFGVVLAELLTGKKALSFDRPEVDRNLALYFVSSMKEGRLLPILDQVIDESNIEQIKEVARIAEGCLRVKGEDRPTMKEVAMELEGILVLEEHRWGSNILSSEETENLLKPDGIGGNGIISSDSYSLNQMSMSLGGR